jgi:integrase
MAKMYFERHSLVNKRSPQTDKPMLTVLTRHFGNKYLHEITQLMVENYRAERKDHVKPSTVNRDFQLLRHIFTKAIEWGYANENPCKRLKLFHVDNQRLRFLSQLEVGKLLSVCDSRVRPLVVAALNTGCRLGELESLKWENVNLERGLLHLLKTKSGKPRHLPINGALQDTLEALPRDREYVFDCSNQRKLFEKALRDAGFNDVTFHTLRHTFASHLVMAGVDLMTVKELLGHQTIEMTMRYAHLSPDHKRVAIELLATQMDTRRGGKVDTKWTPNGHQEGVREQAQVKFDTINQHGPLAQPGQSAPLITGWSVVQIHQGPLICPFEIMGG